MANKWTDLLDKADELARDDKLKARMRNPPKTTKLGAAIDGLITIFSICLILYIPVSFVILFFEVLND